MQRLSTKIKKLFIEVDKFNPAVQSLRQILYSIHTEQLRENIRRQQPEALLLKGHRAFSQYDEDGIISEIFERIGATSKTFVEIGCGNGLENNTHHLLLQGWRGLWIDGSAANIKNIRSELPSCPTKLVVKEAFISRDNALGIVSAGMNELTKGANKDLKIDFLSLDVDGNDLEILKSLENIDARVICVEYNPVFKPPISISIDYDKNHIWKNDCYHGASLQAFCDLLSARDYALVGCNITGYNAFFVKRDNLKDLSELSAIEAFQPARGYLSKHRSGHRRSFQFLANVLGSQANTP